MRMRFFLLSAIIGLLSFSCGRGQANQKEVTIGFYNVENLFDTIDNANTRDEEYTPGSPKAYTSKRYWEKIDHLAKVINAFPNGSPDILGVAEVENRSVLEDMVKRHFPHYQIKHFESPDKRGIDVALLYNPKIFKPSNAYVLPVKYEFEPRKTTRDILKVTGKLGKKETDFYVTHWPSRSGGTLISMPKRMVAGATLRNSIDSSLSKDSQRRIIVMGDFNDEPSDTSVVVALRADTIAKENKPGLFNPFFAVQRSGQGSYNYRGDYNMLDQIIISYPLTKTKSGEKAYEVGMVRHDWMMYKRSDGTMAPSRSYSRNKYYGGYSDHLPVYMKLKL